MKRFKVLFGQRRVMVLVTLTILVLAAAALAASSASFTATSANPGNMFTSGTLTMSNSHPGVAILNASLMVPGDTTLPGTVTITNTGDVDGRFYLTIKKSADAGKTELKNFGDVLLLHITGTGTGYTYANDITVSAADLAGALDVGTIPAHVAVTYSVTAEFPDTDATPRQGADNAYQGGRVTADFSWEAVNL
jgi:hypothetical protein